MAKRLEKDLTRNFMARFGRGPAYAISPMFAWDVFKVGPDDFEGPTINTYRWTVGNGGGASAASPAISAGLENGQIQMVTGTANDNTASSTLCSGRHLYGQNNAIIVARLAIGTSIGSVKVEVGFRDAITTTAGAHFVTNDKATATFTATDGVVWAYDSSDNAYWEGLGVAAASGATTLEAAISPVAATFEYLEVALEGTTAHFRRYNADGGLTYSGVMTDAISADVMVAPLIAVEAKSATSKTLYVDWVFAYQGRTTV